MKQFLNKAAIENRNIMEMFGTLSGLMCILGASRLLLVVMGAYHRRFHPAPEIVRKLLHAGMGSILLLCPFLFDRPWPVLLLGAIFIALLIARSFLPFLHRHVAEIIYGVERPSRGEFYFPLSVAALFILSGGDRLEYCIPLMLLTYADAAAAIVGMRWGRCVFQAPGGRKSVEGCAAFFAMALTLCSVPLLVQGHLGPAVALLMALNIALVTTLLEAASWRGLDNLSVPLAAWAMLRWLPTLSGPQYALGVAVAGAALFLATSRRGVGRGWVRA